MSDFKAMSDADLDSWIAEHVMGWKLRKSTNGNIIADCGDDDVRVIHYERWTGLRRFQPTTDWNDAMLAAEEMRKQHRTHFCILMSGHSGNYRVSALRRDESFIASQINSSGPRAMSEALAMAKESAA